MNDTAAPEPGEVPLFPLNTVLFPGGPLPLRIFEARYLDMVSECLRGPRPFGVCLITEGHEAGRAADTVSVGTLAEIVDWHQYEDGVLGITALGRERFRIIDKRVADNQLAWVRIARLPTPEPLAIPVEYQELVTLTRALVEHAGPLYDVVPVRYEDANWVADRLCEILPVTLDLKQALLECNDTPLRLGEIAQIVQALASSGTE